MPDKPPPTEDARSSANTLRVENQALAKGFTLIPNYILRATGLSRDAKMLYSILLSYAWQTDSCFPGYDRLMDDMQCAKEALAKYIKELKTCGLIEVQRRGQGMTSLYTLKDVAGDTIQKFDNRTSRSSDLKPQEVRKSNAKNTHGIIHREEYSSNTRKGPRRLKTHTDAEGIKRDQFRGFDRIPPLILNKAREATLSHEASFVQERGTGKMRNH